MKIKMTDDLDTRNKILTALKANDNYCPCRLEKTEENKCMCKDFFEQESGFCHCGLYYKEKD